MRNIFIPIIFAFVAACSAAPEAAADEEPRIITVTGVGEVSAKPDMAIMTIGVTSEAASAAEALRQNSKAIASAIDTLKKSGVAAKDMQTSGLSVNPRYDYDRNRSTPEVVGFTASNSVSVKLRKLEKAGDVIDATVQSGANTLNGLEFTFAEPRPLEDEARRLAVADASAKAALYAKAAGVTLGPVRTINEGYISAPAPMAMRAMAMESKASVPMEAGESSISASVTIVYEIN